MIQMEVMGGKKKHSQRNSFHVRVRSFDSLCFNFVAMPFTFSASSNRMTVLKTNRLTKRSGSITTTKERMPLVIVSLRLTVWQVPVRCDTFLRRMHHQFNKQSLHNQSIHECFPITNEENNATHNSSSSSNNNNSSSNNNRHNMLQILDFYSSNNITSL